MKFKFAISALAACALASGAAMADPPKHNKKHNRATSGSVAAGIAAAGPNGAVAGGGAGSVATKPGMTQRQTRRSSQDGDRMTSTTTRCIPNSAATTSSNTAFADRKTAAGASTTSGTAQGSGEVSASSDGYATAERSRDSSFADAAGASTATARPSRRC